MRSLYTNTNFPSTRFVAYLTLGLKILGIIGQDALNKRETKNKISGGQ